MTKGHITVGLAFDDLAEDLVKVGANLAKAYNLPIKFIHVVNPVQRAPYLGVVEEHSPLWDVTTAICRAQTEIAHDSIVELTKGLDVESSIQVFTGEFTEWINADAEANGSKMILVGHHQKRFFPDGFNKVHKLIKHAKVPVMIFNGQHKLAGKPTLMVADDLAPENKALPGFAADFACRTQASEIYHLFVNGISRDGLRQGIETAAIAERSGPLFPEMFDDIVKDLHGKLTERLAERFIGDKKEVAEKLFEYFPVVLDGAPETELIKFCEERKPDVLIFGKHKRFHEDPFYFGKMPLKALLKTNVPVVIVPNK